MLSFLRSLYYPQRVSIVRKNDPATPISTLVNDRQRDERKPANVSCQHCVCSPAKLHPILCSFFGIRRIEKWYRFLPYKFTI